LRKIISFVAALGLVTAIAAVPAQANPVVIAPAWAAVVIIGAVVTGAVIAGAAAKRNHCRFENVRNPNGNLVQVYICN